MMGGEYRWPASDEYLPDPAVAVAVVGAGLGGMHAGLLLAARGCRVSMIERSPWIGGSMHVLDYTFPTDSCGLCFLEPTVPPQYCPTFVCQSHPLIQLLPLSRVEGCSREGEFLRLHGCTLPRYVREDICDGCGLCAEVCPVDGPALYEGNWTRRRAIYAPPARAIPNAYVIDPSLCNRCGRCVLACPHHAIDLTMEPRRFELAVAAVIASPGYELADPARKGEYGFGHYANVITSVEFERLLSYSGNTGGTLLRPSDRRPARKIAFVSCVGSRDQSIGRDYCSSICCMISAKQATVARRLDPQVECTIYYTDLRAKGREYERYLDARKSQPGLRYIRCQVSTIKQRQSNCDLLIESWDEAGRRQTNRFDLVVLATGFDPPAEAHELASTLHIETDRYGFARSRLLSVSDSPAAVVPIGAFTGPKDIPDTIIEASAASALVAGQTACLRAHEPRSLSLSQGRPDLADEPIRLGVLLCSEPGRHECFPSPSLVARVKALPDIEVVADISDIRSEEGIEAAIQWVGRERLNRVLVAGLFSPRDAVLDRQLERLSLTLGLPDSAIGKADLSHVAGFLAHEAVSPVVSALAMAVAALRARQMVKPVPVVAAGDLISEATDVDVVVIGGGPAGLSAAGALASLGHRIAIIERKQKLGGRLRELAGTLEEERPHVWLAAQEQELHHSRNVEIYTGIEPLDLSRQGNLYLVRMRCGGEPRLIRSKSLILATGSPSATMNLYQYGRHPRIITQWELERALAAGDVQMADYDAVAMIQCAGSREPGRPYCSQTCCSVAVKHALQLKRINSRQQIFILYRDMRTIGMHELAYAEARRAGVRFIRYELPARPQVHTPNRERVEITVEDVTIAKLVRLEVDLLSLSTGVYPWDMPAAWRDALGLTLNEDGFLASEHPKMRPLHLGQPGLYGCGSVMGPCFIHEAILQGRAAAMYASVYLCQSSGSRPAASAVVSVNQRLCSGCELCVRACPHGARRMHEHIPVAEVMESLCAGCGICATVCPNDATQQRLFEPRSILAMVDAALQWE